MPFMQCIKLGGTVTIKVRAYFMPSTLTAKQNLPGEKMKRLSISVLSRFLADS